MRSCTRSPVSSLLLVQTSESLDGHIWIHSCMLPSCPAGIALMKVSRESCSECWMGQIMRLESCMYRRGGQKMVCFDQNQVSKTSELLTQPMQQACSSQGAWTNHPPLKYPLSPQWYWMLLFVGPLDERIHLCNNLLLIDTLYVQTL